MQDRRKIARIRPEIKVFMTKGNAGFEKFLVAGAPYLVSMT